MASHGRSLPDGSLRWVDALWPILPCALAVLVYYPITRNYFFGDDLFSLYKIVNGDLFTYLVTPGEHLLFTRNCLFYLCYRLFGTEPQGYFWVVLATHAVNVALLFRIIRAFTGSAILACFGAALWGASPVQEGTLGWYSVYGQVVAATFLLWPLDELGQIARGHVVGRWTIVRWCVLLVAATTSFGVGMGVAIVFPLVVALLHPPHRYRWTRILGTAAVAAAIPPLYFTILRVTLPPENTIFVRSFFSLQTLAHWEEILVSVLTLAGYGTASLLLGDVYPLKTFGGAIPSAALALYLGVLLFAFVRGGAASRRRLAACVLMAAAAFGIIAAGRWYFPNFYLATRYQYVALIPVTLALCLALNELDRWWSLPFTLKSGLLVAWMVGTMGAHVWLGRGMDHHEAARRATTVALDEIRRLIDATPAGQSVYIPNRPFGGVGPLMIRHPRYFPGWAAAFVIFFPDDVVDGRRVFFVESDPEALAGARAGPRTATLVLTPEQVQRSQATP